MSLKAIARRGARVAFGGVVLASVLAACGAREPLSSAGTGSVRVALSAEVRDAGRLSRLRVTLASAALHEADKPFAEGWAPLPLVREDVDLDAPFSKERSVLVADGQAPAKRYDHVRVDVETVLATEAADRPVQTRNIVEAIALPMDVRTGVASSIRLELILLDHPDGGFALFAKAAELVKGDAGP